MGAAASIQLLYQQATSWFQKYFDEDMYVLDFEAIDKDSDGGITYEEMEKWIKSKADYEAKTQANPGAPRKTGWNTILSHPEILKIAHDRSAKTVLDMTANSRSSTFIKSTKIVDVTDFRNFLVHLFAISTLWVHFKNADEWREGNPDVGNETLSFEEFRMAIKTITGAYAKENLTEEQIKEAFLLLDTNKSDSIQFLEVCDFCCQFIVSKVPEDANGIAARVATPSTPAGGEAAEEDAFIGSAGHQKASSMLLKMELSKNLMEKEQKLTTTSVEDRNRDMMIAMEEQLGNTESLAARVATEVHLKDMLGEDAVF